jgi:hypothetical protein
MRIFLFLSLFIFIIAGPALCQETSSVERPDHELIPHWYNVTTISIATTTGQFFNGMQTIMGYRIIPELGVGIGAGVERFSQMPLYDGYKANLSMLPLFADIRYTILRSRVSPVIALNLGYKFLLNIPSTQYTTHTDTVYSGYAWNSYYSLDTYKTGGWFLGAEAGVKMRIARKFFLNAFLGYSLWSVSGTRNEWLYQFLPSSQGGIQETDILTTYKSTAITHTFMFRVGFGF